MPLKAPFLFPDASHLHHRTSHRQQLFLEQPLDKRENRNGQQVRPRHHTPSLFPTGHFHVTINPDQQRIQKNCPKTTAKQVPTSVGDVYHHVQTTHQETVWYLGMVISTPSWVARSSRNLSFRPGPPLSKPRKMRCCESQAEKFLGVTYFSRVRSIRSIHLLIQTTFDPRLSSWRIQTK